MLAVLAYRTAAVLAGVLPVPLAEALARGIARLAWAARVPARAALEQNLALLQPAATARQRQACAGAAFEHFALAFTRFLRGDTPQAADPAATPQAIAVVGREHLEAARASGRGVIVLSAHLGDWEGGAALLAAQGVPLHVAARRHPAAAVERLFAQRRCAAGLSVLPVDGLFANSATVLRRQEWVAIMADRGALRAGGPSVCAWAAALAQRTGALVLPAVCVRDERGRLALCIEAPLTPARCRDGAFRDTMARWIARWPGQWAAFEPVPEGLA